MRPFDDTFSASESLFIFLFLNDATDQFVLHLIVIFLPLFLVIRNATSPGKSDQILVHHS